MCTKCYRFRDFVFGIYILYFYFMLTYIVKVKKCITLYKNIHLIFFYFSLNYNLKLKINYLNTVNICLNPHSFKSAFRVNSHLERKNSRINNFMTLILEKFT